MPFETTQTSLDSGVVVLALSGSMTMGNQLQRFEWLIDELIKENHNCLILDLSKISYLDSAGLGVLLKSSGLAKQAAGKLLLAAPSEQVLSVIKLTSLDTVLAIHSTLDEAVSALAI